MCLPRMMCLPCICLPCMMCLPRMMSALYLSALFRRGIGECRPIPAAALSAGSDFGLRARCPANRLRIALWQRCSRAPAEGTANAARLMRPTNDNGTIGGNAVSRTLQATQRAQIAHTHRRCPEKRTGRQSLILGNTHHHTPIRRNVVGIAPCATQRAQPCKTLTQQCHRHQKAEPGDYHSKPLTAAKPVRSHWVILLPQYFSG
jgi:hypothetical protein